MRSLIYPVPSVPVGEPPAGFEESSLTLADGARFLLWHRASSPEKPVLLYFHGNGENLETLKWWGLYDRLAPLGTTVVVEYPGYGRSTGAPSEPALATAAERAAAWVGDRFPRRPLVVIGWSLGAAVAVRLAATRPQAIDRLIVLSPWASLEEVAAAHFPRWLLAMALRESWDSLGAASSIDRPVLILHGTRDAIIPVEQSQRLAESFGAVRWIPVEGAGHNDLLGESTVWREIESFVASPRPLEGV